MLLYSITIWLVLAQSSLPSHPPRWFDTTLAGYKFAYDEKHAPVAIYDPKSHYILIRVVECDGADLTLLLTRDRYEVTDMGFAIPGFKKQPETPEFTTTVKALPSLSTGKGLQIGDSVAKVRRRLGAPGKTEVTGARKQFLSYKYSFAAGESDDSREYDETYVFKAGKLIEILLNWDPVHHEDKAVVAPKAKKAVANPSGGDLP